MTTARYRPGDYAVEFVEALVETWDVLTLYRHHPAILVWLADLERCLKRLPTQERQAVFLHGMAGFTCKASGPYMDRSDETVRRHYHRGITRLHLLMNGHGW